MLLHVSPPNPSVAAAVRAELARAGISRRQLARELDVDPAWLDRRLAPPTDKRELTPFTVDELHMIAVHIGVPITSVLGDLVQHPAAIAS